MKKWFTKHLPTHCSSVVEMKGFSTLSIEIYHNSLEFVSLKYVVVKF